MLFQQYLPDLFEHFEKEGIETSFYATRWFLTLWGDTLPLPVVVRIWDLFLYEGPRIIYSVGIGLLQLSKGICTSSSLATLLEQNFTGIMETLHAFKKTFLDANLVIKKATSLSITETMINQYKVDCNLTPDLV